MLRKYVNALLILVLLSSVSLAGIRGPGEYSGIVVFDRWDTCYLYDGVYLMYISEKVKERVRKYEEQIIRIDAKEVYQPMNPGDGLIKAFRFLPPMKEKGSPQLAGLTLTIIPNFDLALFAQFILVVKNTTTKKLLVAKWQLAPTLFGERSEEDFLSPSDGKSHACVTRWSLPLANGNRSETWQKKTEDGESVTVHKWYGLEIDDGKVPFDYLTLYPGQSSQFKASFSLSPGTYDFLCGYAPGREKLVSNIASFTVDRYGIATMISDRRIGETSENPNPKRPRHHRS